MEQNILAWIAHYGYFAVFTLLMFGIVGLPVPDETLLTFSGYLAYKGNFSLALVFLAAWAGSTCGITISFYLGRTFGMGLIHRYGKYAHIREDHIKRAHAWFDRVGHWGLTFGYFIPGVRHVSAFAAGMSEVTPPQFALYAYSGGFIWVSAFLALGYFLGDKWESVERDVHHYALLITIIGAVGLAAYLIWRKWFRRAS
ncbi:MAG TPA: DedA family protein [Bryobacteraceae bacterium]|nr:DedA family protein [Bryobacteraceae bacterium]